MVQPIHPLSPSSPSTTGERSSLTPAAAGPPSVPTPSDRLQTSNAADSTDARRDKLLQQQLARLGLSAAQRETEIAPTWQDRLRSAWQSWTRPDVTPEDVAKEQLAAIDNLVALQDKRAFPVLQAVALRDDMFPEVRGHAWEALAELAPYFDSRDLIGLTAVIDEQLAGQARQTARSDGLAPSSQLTFNRLWAIKTRVEGEITRRQQGGQAKEPDVSLILKNYRDAGLAILKTPVNIALGLGKTVVQDPVKAPTRLVYGLGSSLVHAVTDLPGEVAGLATAGAVGASGSELGDQVANTLIWALPVARTMSERRPVASDVAEFKTIQEKSGGRFTRVVYGKKPNWAVRKYHQIKLGATNIEYLDDAAKPRRVKGAVWHESEYEARMVKGDVNLAHEHFGAAKRFDNKLYEAQFLEKVAPGSVPKTISIKDIAAKLGLPKPKTLAEKVAYLEALEGELKARFPDGYILKDVKGYNTGGNLPTEKTGFAPLYKGFLESFKPFKEKLLQENTDPNFDPQSKLRSHEFHAGETLDALLKDPKRVVVQQKVKLSKYTQKPLPRDVQPFNEYRVHVLNGKVLPGATSHRWGIVQTLLQAEQIKRAEAFVQSVFDRFPKEIRDKLSFAPDVALLEDGSFVFIELNVGGASGFLTRNPLAVESLARAVTGRESQGKTLLRALGSGIVTGTAAGTQQQN